MSCHPDLFELPCFVKQVRHLTTRTFHLSLCHLFLSLFLPPGEGGGKKTLLSYQPATDRHAKVVGMPGLSAHPLLMPHFKRGRVPTWVDLICSLTFFPSVLIKQANVPVRMQQYAKWSMANAFLSLFRIRLMHSRGRHSLEL